jgi:hypothetical protein
MLTNEIKHSISVKFNNALNQHNDGKLSLEQVIALIDETAIQYPGEERQQNFYQVMRDLAKQCDAQLKKWQQEKANV